MIEWLKSLTPELITAFTACIAAVGSLMGMIIMFFMGRHQHKATIRASVAAAKDAWIINFSDKF
jgi:membrane protein DedA with SNARE-associated domain